MDFGLPLTCAFGFALVVMMGVLERYPRGEPESMSSTEAEPELPLITLDGVLLEDCRYTNGVIECRSPPK